MFTTFFRWFLLGILYSAVFCIPGSVMVIYFDPVIGTPSDELHFLGVMLTVWGLLIFVLCCIKALLPIVEELNEWASEGRL